MYTIFGDKFVIYVRFYELYPTKREKRVEKPFQIRLRNFPQEKNWNFFFERTKSGQITKRFFFREEEKREKKSFAGAINTKVSLFFLTLSKNKEKTYVW